MRNIIIILFTMLLLPVLAMAQFTGGNGRGDFMLGYSPCTNPENGGVIEADQVICYGTAPSPFTSVSLPSGHTGTLEYQWQINTSTPTANWEDVGSVTTTATYQHPTELTQTTWFRRLARVDCKTDWVESNVVEITVYPDFTVGTIETTGETICYNCDPAEIGNSTVASGGDGSISYRWQSSTEGPATGFTDIPGSFFDTDALNSYVAINNPSWFTTWNNSPGTFEDAVVKNDFSHSVPNSALVADGTDLVLKLGDKTTGAYDLNWWMYIENGNGGYYNIQHFETQGTEWAFEIYLNVDGSGLLLTGFSTYNFTYPKATWFQVKHYINLDADEISLYINDVLIRQWPFHYQSDSPNGTNMLGGVDFYADPALDSKYYLDDIYFAQREVPNDIVLLSDYFNTASYDPPSGLTVDTWYSRLAKDETCNTDWETSTGVWKVSIETTPPTASANDTTLYLDSNGTISVTAESIDNGSTDNCSIASYSLDKSSFDCTDLGTNPVILTVTDNAGNSATANSVVTIVDTITPVAKAKNVTIILDPNGNASITGESIDDGSSDNCSITLTASRTTFNCSDRGPNSVTLTVEDISGNAATANCIVTVEEGTDILPPWENENTHVSANGSATYAPCDHAGTFRLTSTGQSSTTSDVYHYIYQELCGNGTIIARLDEVENGGWAGVMMRETNDAGSRAILIKTRLYNPTVNIGYRTTPNKSMSNTSQVVQMLQWMKIQRNGNTFQIFTSVNGTNWTRRYTSTIAMNSCINAGIFTESIKSNRISIALFDQVSLWNTLKSGDGSNQAEIIDLENEQVDVHIYPNPAKDVVSLTLTGFKNLSGLEATLLTTEGKTVKTITLTSMQTELNVQELKPGIYILRLENAENVVVKSFVIQ